MIIFLQARIFTNRYFFTFSLFSPAFLRVHNPGLLQLSSLGGCPRQAYPNPYRCIFVKLCTMQKRFHCVFTFTLPRKVKRSRPMADVICEKGGSLIARRIPYVTRPMVESILRFILSVKVGPSPVRPAKYATWRITVSSDRKRLLPFPRSCNVHRRSINPVHDRWDDWVNIRRCQECFVSQSGREWIYLVRRNTVYIGPRLLLKMDSNQMTISIIVCRCCSSILNAQIDFFYRFNAANQPERKRSALAAG